MGSVTVRRSPARHCLPTTTQPPLAGPAGTRIPAPLSCTRGGPAAQDGTRTRSVIAAAPDVTSIVTTGSSGKPVVWRSVIPRSAQVTSDGMNRLTDRPLGSRE
jgi:hypothetical protein